MEFRSIKYLGGLPYPFGISGYIDVKMDRIARCITFLQPGNVSFSIPTQNIISVTPEERKQRSLGKGIVGYVIGDLLHKKYGGLLGAAIGARSKDASILLIQYRLNNRIITLILNPGKRTYDLYASLNSLLLM